MFNFSIQQRLTKILKLNKKTLKFKEIKDISFVIKSNALLHSKRHLLQI